VLAVPTAYEQLEDRLPNQLRRRLEYGRRRLAREGTLRFDWLRNGDIQDGLTDLFRLHRERWRRKGQPGVLENPAVRKFHRAVAALFDARGELRLVRMRVGDRVAAVYYGFQAFRQAWFYIAAFDPSIATANPGTVLLSEILRAAISDGVEAFDFLSGQEPYKYEWGAIDRPHFARTLAPRAQAGAAPCVPTYTA
jgi:CelD/BcsL family acetyltransferase involved in cellulose biosynthesis